MAVEQPFAKYFPELPCSWPKDHEPGQPSLPTLSSQRASNKISSSQCADLPAEMEVFGSLSLWPEVSTLRQWRPQGPPNCAWKLCFEFKGFVATVKRVSNPTFSSLLHFSLMMQLPLAQAHPLPVENEKPSRMAEMMEEKLADVTRTFLEATPLAILYFVICILLQRISIQGRVRECRTASLVGALLPSVIADARSSTSMKIFTTILSSHLIMLYGEAWSPGFHRSSLKLGTLILGTFSLDALFCRASAPNQGIESALFWQLLAISGWCVLWVMQLGSAYRDPLRGTLEWGVEYLR